PIEQRSCTAGSTSADLNGNTFEPSELVPSGKRTTTGPPAIASRILFTTFGLENFRSRSTKIVPAACANQPNSGHLATSRTAQNRIPARYNSRDLAPPVGPSAIGTCRQFRSWRFLRRLSIAELIEWVDIEPRRV